ncbi:MAG: Ig-like domain-containing protein, partial [Archangium sp.]|nr:Ig-like domain-containing protein [Archangium sp.]
MRSLALRLAALTAVTLCITGCPEPVTPPTPDTTAPTITGFTPAEGATNVAFDAALTASFSEAISSDGLAASLRQGSTSIMGTFALSSDKKTLTFTPNAPLPEKASLVFSVTT